ncbi:MAG: CatA-like O-acetyltransferase [Christiangramia sp.]
MQDLRGESLYPFKINASTTISRSDNTFGFSHIIYDEDFASFIQNAENEMDRIRDGRGLMLEEVRQNEVHYSAILWVKFTSLSHSRNYSNEYSCPKFSFGKITLKNGKRTMPVSINVHHALMDGYHVGLFIEKFQKLLNGSLE